MQEILDLFCGGGGAAAGYVYAGFKVTGVDFEYQNRYPFTFVQADARDYLERLTYTGEISRYTAIHASPPCQAFMRSGSIHKYYYPNLISEIRILLLESGLPYVIENVPGSPLLSPVRLCGKTFNLQTYRHRLFETSFPVHEPRHPLHREVRTKMGHPPKEGEMLDIVGNFSGVDYARRAMRIKWLPRSTLKEAIPPVYTQYIGMNLRRHLEV